MLGKMVGRSCSCRDQMTDVAMMLCAVLVMALGVISVAYAGAARLPDSQFDCAPGWDFLLPEQQKVPHGCSREATPRGESLALSGDMDPSLAEQLQVYTAPVLQISTRPLTVAQVVANPAKPKQIRQRASRRVGAPLPAHRSLLYRSTPVAVAPLIDSAARRHDIDPLLLHAIARVESRHQPQAVSPAGAYGLMQVIVPTAKRFGVDDTQTLQNPEVNLSVSARYLKTLQQRFGNNLALVLAAYNAGEGAVEKYGRRIPPYPETQTYVRKVLAEYALLRRVYIKRVVSLTGAMP